MIVNVFSGDFHKMYFIFFALRLFKRFVCITDELSNNLRTESLPISICRIRYYIRSPLTSIQCAIAFERTFAIISKEIIEEN